jgi:hypothetical protein
MTAGNPRQFSFRRLRRLASEGVYIMPALGNTALKLSSKCSFTHRKLRFFAQFRLVLPSLAYFVNALSELDAQSLRADYPRLKQFAVGDA